MKAKSIFNTKNIVPECPNCGCNVYFHPENEYECMLTGEIVDTEGYVEFCETCGYDFKKKISWFRKLKHRWCWGAFVKRYPLYECHELIEIRELEKMFQLEFKHEDH